MRVYRGTIAYLHGSWMSGLATLSFEDGSMVHCDNGATVRALDACYGNVIGLGHTINNEALAGKEIYYSIDGMGVLDGFTPVEDASGELFEAYERTRSEEDMS